MQDCCPTLRMVDVEAGCFKILRCAQDDRGGEMEGWRKCGKRPVHRKLDYFPPGAHMLCQ